MNEHAAAAPIVEVPLVGVWGIGESFRNGTVALEGVDLSVAAGAFLSLLGPRAAATARSYA